MVSDSALVPTFFATTLAFGITAPFGSFTNPEILPVSPCPQTVVAVRTAMRQNKSFLEMFMLSPTGWFVKRLRLLSLDLI